VEVLWAETTAESEATATAHATAHAESRAIKRASNGRERRCRERRGRDLRKVQTEDRRGSDPVVGRWGILTVQRRSREARSLPAWLAAIAHLPEKRVIEMNRHCCQTGRLYSIYASCIHHPKRPSANRAARPMSSLTRAKVRRVQRKEKMKRATAEPPWCLPPRPRPPVFAPAQHHGPHPRRHLSSRSKQVVDRGSPSLRAPTDMMHNPKRVGAAGCKETAGPQGVTNLLTQMRRQIKAYSDSILASF
jgi:hypothetical protein